jgi:hypothetical protein
MSPRRGRTDNFTGMNSCPGIKSKKKPESVEDDKEEEEE